MEKEKKKRADEVKSNGLNGIGSDEQAIIALVKGKKTFLYLWCFI